MQVIDVAGEEGLANEHVAPTSTPGPAVYAHEMLLCGPSGSTTLPLSAIGEPSTPLASGPASTVGELLPAVMMRISSIEYGGSVGYPSNRMSLWMKTVCRSVIWSTSSNWFVLSSIFRSTPVASMVPSGPRTSDPSSPLWDTSMPMIVASVCTVPASWKSLFFTGLSTCTSWLLTVVPAGIVPGVSVAPLV